MGKETLIAAVMAAHLVWIIFMLAGIAFTAAAFFKPELFRFASFRRAHLAGLLFTAAFAAVGEPCPLTTLENSLRVAAGGGPGGEGFIIRLLERLIYYDVPPLAIAIPTVLAGLFVSLAYILRPPPKKRG